MTKVASIFSSIKKTIPVTILLDSLLLPLALWASFALRFSEWWPVIIQENWWLFVVAPSIAIPLFIRNGLYRAVLLYISTTAFYTIIKVISIHVIMFVLVAIVVDYEAVPFTVYSIYWFVSLTLIGGSRAFLRTILQWFNKNKHTSTNVVIYGAGAAGAELGEALQAGREFLPIAYIDDKRELHGQEIRGLKVVPTQDLDMLIDKYGVKQVLLAIPSAPRARRFEVMNFLEKRHVHVKTVPALMDVVSGRSQVSDLREVDIEDILGREPVPPDEHLLSICITGKSVLVTGAGGSIGSELCRQIISLKPSCLVLFEACEFALYNIEQELIAYCLTKYAELGEVKIIPVLGTVTNQHKLELVLKAFKVNTLYHAAAYKHVPLVEYNPMEGVKNNVFGTYHAALAALEASVETFIMISTDKAVRPTNVMGATKRLAEMVIQGFSSKYDTTCFSMVRFGNVLGSSGSVVPLFRKQIQDGGPITLTHQDITRFFMTIPEAAQLVIQAGAMASGGDVFVLDMGEPVRIYDMARHMISLSGLTVRDENNPYGDISIEVTHLRPGEKLYEELLLGENVTGTIHSRILRAQEVELPW
ncbi:MAG: polysaccharide biosynthesis protein, partial [Gammaproteobacteria bacterium]|nr:polysaccharide biosynthesis protein [Gammaproteobacteria bacterium]